MRDIKYRFRLALYLHPFLKRINGKDVIFIHIPKTGGTSIVHTLKLNNPMAKIGIKKHYTAEDILKVMKQEHWDRALSFCFVRNPWDRMYSFYTYRRRKKDQARLPFEKSYNKWLLDVYKRKNKLNMLQPQLDWITDNNGDIMVNHIYRFESINEDFKRIANLINANKLYSLKHVNVSNTGVDYRSQYTQESIKIIQELYQKDIEAFGYSFDPLNSP